MPVASTECVEAVALAVPSAAIGPMASLALSTSWPVTVPMLAVQKNDTDVGLDGVAGSAVGRVRRCGAGAGAAWPGRRAPTAAPR